MPAQVKKTPCCTGLLAHVDAGKTTLSEALLYQSGERRTLGRVDHADAFLDTHALERARGITIFSKQAKLETENRIITLVDTPGHVDFSAEAERVLPVLDCAVLVIGGQLQAHTATLWNLLQRYHVPTILFISKMDLPGKSREELMADLTSQLSSACVDFSGDMDAVQEAAAMCDEALLETYLETGTVTDGNIRELVANRKLFPCCFGSGLKLQGIDRLLDILDKFAPTPQYGADFGAKVYKISRDPQGNRLTWLKVTGGRLQVRDTGAGIDRPGQPFADCALVHGFVAKRIALNVAFVLLNALDLRRFRHGNHGPVRPPVPLAQNTADLINMHRIFGDGDHLSIARDAGMNGDPAGMPPHQLHYDYAAMAHGRELYIVQRRHGVVTRRVKTKGIVRSGQVIVDRFGNAHHVHPHLL